MIGVLHKFKVKILSWMGLTIDIRSKAKGVAGILSNFTENHFVFDEMECHSMEGFLQSLKYQDPEEQKQTCALVGKYAKRMSTDAWKETQTVHWKREPINRHSDEFIKLVKDAYSAMYDQCPKFRDALLATGNKRIYHTMGNPDPSKTILTEKEFCSILTDLRSRQ